MTQLGGVAVCALILTACGTGGPPPFSVTNATADVAITHCGENSSGDAVAEIKVTNHSSAEADYVTTVAFSSGHSTAKSGPGFERGVGPGTSVVDQVISTTILPPRTKITCKVSSVRRTPSTVTTTT
jgi:hypothetical protein